MSLDVGRVSSAPAPAFEISNGYSARPVFKSWEWWEPSPISHHARACCEIAREWLVDIDFSSLNGANPLTGPRWLRQRFEWGPSRYPIHWCELVTKEKLDCGVLAALAHEIFISRGVRSYRAQLVQEFCDSSAATWRASWENDDAITSWIYNDLIYHEGCAVVVRDNEIKLWDASAGWWVDPKTTGGYGSIVALRVSAPEDRELVWGNHKLQAHTWTELS